jgi:hypothetical protein
VCIIPLAVQLLILSLVCHLVHLSSTVIHLLKLVFDVISVTHLAKDHAQVTRPNSISHFAAGNRDLRNTNFLSTDTDLNNENVEVARAACGCWRRLNCAK